LIRNFHALGVLEAVCDLSPDTVQGFCKQYRGVHGTTHVQDIMSNPVIDGVVIATPSHTHYALARTALSVGKHVYVEKPMATSAEEAQELERLASELGRVLMVGHLLLYHPAVNRLRQLVADGTLGDIRYIQSDRLNFNLNRSDRNVLWDLAPHDLSMMMYVLGGLEPEAVLSANGHRTSEDDRVDVAHVELRFPGGAGGHIHNSWVHPAKHVRLVVRGSERMAILDDTLTIGKLRLFEQDEKGKLLEESPEYLSLEPLKLECQHFINCIRFGMAPKTGGLNGNSVVRIIETAERMMTVESPPAKVYAEP
jgi:UDP-2-acetamido-3-amino-2,3-dideoxy-glucuronate N-acetyltransferase